MKKIHLIILLILLSQYNLFAYEAKDMLGKWGVTTFAFIPKGGDFNSPGISYIYANVGWDFYFNENGKGNVVIPKRGIKYKNVDFQWSLSNDTLNIVRSDTLAQFKIDKSKEKKDVLYLYLRLIKRGAEYFDRSYIAGSHVLKASDFLYDPNLNSIGIDSIALRKIVEIKKDEKIDKIVIGYQDKDNKVYYSNDNDKKENNNYNLFDEIKNGTKQALAVLAVMYNPEKKSFVKLTQFNFYYDEYLPDKVDFSYWEDYPFEE